MTHHFEVGDAEKFGVNAAIILSNIKFWISKNRANEKHQHEGRTWTYNSVKAFSELFPYLTNKQVRTAIDKLVKKGVLIQGRFNKLSYDHTKWFALADEETICPQGQKVLPSGANGFALGGNAIPYSKPYKKPDMEEVVEYMIEKLPLINEGWTPERVRKAVTLKYETCSDNGWKDGHGKKILNWKLKFQNMLKFEKPWSYTDNTMPATSQKPQAARIL